jgi:hypothetical protein
MQMIDIAIPQTGPAQRALEVAAAFSSEALVNHCERSYLWAAALGIERGMTFDAELLYVAAMLHDIGLTPSFDNHALPFEIAGGHVGWVFGAGVGWDAHRRERIGEIIVRHMWDAVDPAVDPEGYLLEVATGLDVSGRNPGWWPASLRLEVVAALPRLDLATEFTACFLAEGDRKPASSTASLVARGIAGRIATNPLDLDPGRDV